MNQAIKHGRWLAVAVLLWSGAAWAEDVVEEAQAPGGQFEAMGKEADARLADAGDVLNQSLADKRTELKTKADLAQTAADLLNSDLHSRSDEAKGRLRDQVQSARSDVNGGIADKQAELGQRLKDGAKERSGDCLKDRVGQASEGQLRDRVSALSQEPAGSRVQSAVGE